MLKGITASEGLLWRDGQYLEVQETDRLANHYGLPCAEELVKRLEEMKLRELLNKTLAILEQQGTFCPMCSTGRFWGHRLECPVALLIGEIREQKLG